MTLRHAGPMLVQKAAWVGGLASPLVVLAFVAAQYWTALGLLLALMGASWCTPATPWTAFQTFRASGSAYFHERSFRTETPLTAAPTASLFCFHPHGIFCEGLTWNAWEPLRERNVRLLITRSLYQAPFARQVLGWLGSFGSVEKANLVREMQRGRAIALLPGGFEEATISEYGVDRVYLRNRTGFIKYALQYGYCVFPVYTFGECRTFHNVPGCWALRLWLNRFSLPAVLPWGRAWCPVLPRPDARLHTVVGAGLPFPKIEHPSAADVAEYHARYTQALVALFDRHKRGLNHDPAATLQVW
jgi:hypothetical protein